MSNPWDPPPGEPPLEGSAAAAPPPPSPVYPHQPGHPGQYGQQPYGQQPYGAGPQYSHSAHGPSYGPPHGRALDQNAIISIVLAALSWAVCPVILAVVALVLASSAQRSIDASGGAKTGDALVKAARIISWLNIVVWGLLIVLGTIGAIIDAGTPDSGTQY